MRERLAARFLHLGLVAQDDFAPITRGQISIEHEILAVFIVLKDFFEIVMVNVEHDIGIHLNEAAIAVIGKALIARIFGQRLNGDIIETQIEHRIHHAGHGGSGTRAHGNQQRVFGIAKAAVGQLANMEQSRFNLLGQFGGILPAVCVKSCAHLGGDGEAGGDRQAQIGHFRQIGALAAQQVLHFAGAFSLAVTKSINPFIRHGTPQILLKKASRRPVWEYGVAR